MILFVRLNSEKYISICYAVGEQLPSVACSQFVVYDFNVHTLCAPAEPPPLSSPPLYSWYINRSPAFFPLDWNLIKLKTCQFGRAKRERERGAGEKHPTAYIDVGHYMRWRICGREFCCRTSHLDNPSSRLCATFKYIF